MKIIHKFIDGKVIHEIDHEIKLTELEKAFGKTYEKDAAINKVMEEGEEIDIKKPYPNEHSARLQDPGRYDKWSRTKDGNLYGERIKVPANVSIIWGHPKGQGPKIWVPQALRFPKDTWNVARAKKWLSDNNVSYKLFEAAKKSVEKYTFRFLKVENKQQIVGGIIYAPDTEDAQGDYTDAKEIEKAMYSFMEKYALNTKKIKVMHKGRTLHFPILECFQPEEDIIKGGYTVPAGAWWLMIKVDDKEVWDDIDQGKLTGFSMGGRARA